MSILNSDSAISFKIKEFYHNIRLSKKDIKIAYKVYSRITDELLGAVVVEPLYEDTPLLNFKIYRGSSMEHCSCCGECVIKVGDDEMSNVFLSFIAEDNRQEYINFINNKSNRDSFLIEHVTEVVLAYFTENSVSSNICQPSFYETSLRSATR